MCYFIVAFITGPNIETCFENCYYFDEIYMVIMCLCVGFGWMGCSVPLMSSAQDMGPAGLAPT